MIVLQSLKKANLIPKSLKRAWSRGIVIVLLVKHRANYKMFTGVKMRRNGDWFAFYNDSVEGIP